MSVALQINVQDGASPVMQQFMAKMRGRLTMHRKVGRRVQNCIRDHLIKLGNSRHNTAAKLGATPTGFLSQAAEKVGRNEAVVASQEAAVITLNHPGMKRAFQAITILPKTAKCLTIPNVAEAYGNRFDSVLRKYGVVSEKTGKLVLPPRADGKRWFLLVPKAHQKQDRSLLPTDQEMKAAALDAATEYVAAIVGRKAEKRNEGAA